MRKLIALVGLTVVEKAQLSRDLCVYFQEQGYSARLLDSPVDQFAEVVTQEIRQSNEPIIIWNTPPETEIERLETLLLDIEAGGIKPVMIALLDARTCDCFPTLREAMEQSADLTVHLPFEFEALHRDIQNIIQ